MADTLTRDDVTDGTIAKTFTLSTPNALFSYSPEMMGIRLEGSKYNRPFVPNRVSIIYSPYPRVHVFSRTGSPTWWGSVTYYDSTKVPANVNQYKLSSKTLQPLSSMPSWLSALVLPQI